MSASQTRLQRYLADEILLTRRNNETDPVKMLATTYVVVHATIDMSPEAVFGLLTYTQTYRQAR